MTKNISEFDYKNAVVGLYLKRLQLAPSSELLDFSFGLKTGSHSTVRVSRISLPAENSSAMFFSGSLGFVEPKGEAQHIHQFINIIESGGTEFTELVAVAFHYDNYISRLEYGNSFPLGPQSILRTKGYSSAVILDPDIYVPFEGVNNEIPNLGMSFFSIIPITDYELEVKRSRGIDGLLELWDQEKKDLLKAL